MGQPGDGGVFGVGGEDGRDGEEGLDVLFPPLGQVGGRIADHIPNQADFHVFHVLQFHFL